MKVYKYHYCMCGCGKRIRFPTTVSGFRHHKYGGIPKYINGHNPTSAKFKKGHKLSSGEDNPRWIDGYCHYRYSSKRRGLGFITLNEKTEKANTMHHLDKKFVIFIPRRVHEKFWHSAKNNIRLKEMNRLALEWCEKEGIELQRSLQSF